MKLRLFHQSVCKRKPVILVLLLVAFFQQNTFAQQNDLPSLRYQNGKLIYEKDSLGNQIPDYSYCGYELSEKPIPVVPVKVLIPPTEQDAGSIIQNAIDYVSSLPLQEDGFRGAILLQEGTYQVNGRLRINASGVVLRGSGPLTILKATGENNENLLSVFGENDKKTESAVKITDTYVPVNSFNFHVENTDNLKVGDQVVIHRPSTEAWINKLKMKDFGGQTQFLGWNPGERDIRWDRKITNIDGNTVSIDAPLTSSLDSKYGGGTISQYSWSGRISHVGIENLTFDSEFDKNNVKDENHCWFAITMENIENAWVRQVQFRHFAGSAVALYETAKSITVQDCISENPISEIGGTRRNTYFTMGQQTLFLRCYASDGYHDFGTGFCAAGPNAFVQCESILPHNFSGTLDSWASGVLFDIVNIDGQRLSLTNRGQNGQGAGWSAANSMIWQCSAAWIECYKPPTSNNFSYANWGQFAGDGIWHESNSQIKPRSLFFAQLADRLVKDPMEYSNEIMPYSYDEGTTSPTIEFAQELSKKAFMPAVSLKDFILKKRMFDPGQTDTKNAVSAFNLPLKQTITSPEIIPVNIKNGWLIRDSKLLVGSKFNVRYWRANARPFAAEIAEPAITRRVPGRTGNGLTDHLQEVIDWMNKEKVISIHHSYGLWYDRRRDDHERIRRMDGDVWAPFFELPFSRSGLGTAWDGLSKYDLTKFNPWYWNRLKEFAVLAEQNGKLLLHQNYLQHNIIEAGAHWTDFPWRTANNVNHTGFPEPPAYAGEKRIYMAEPFYDINNRELRELHRNYIRKCLDNFVGQSNVIQSLSAEYTGPLEFMQFWLDVVAEWEKETKQNELVSLCATKDVQDAILADPVRSKIVDIIDIRYWGYRDDGSLYAPPGGKNMAPRQHARKVDPGDRDFKSVYKTVSEYKSKFPDKAVIYSEGIYTDTGWSVFNFLDEKYKDIGWAVFMAGGSLPPIPEIDNGLLEAASKMKPITWSGNLPNVWAMENKNGSLILWCQSQKSIQIDLEKYEGDFTTHFIDPDNGKLIDTPKKLKGGKKTDVELPSLEKIIVWINKKQ